MRRRTFTIPHLQMKMQNEQCDREGWASHEEKLAAGMVEGALRTLSQSRDMHPKMFWLREHLAKLDEVRTKARK